MSARCGGVVYDYHTRGLRDPGQGSFAQRYLQVMMARFVFLLLLCIGCRPGLNYRNPAAPRYAGAARVIATPSRSDTIRIISFNVEYAKEAGRAARVLRRAAPLRDADIILLQEMTAPATKLIADSLRMRYVYYPAIYNR